MSEELKPDANGQIDVGTPAPVVEEKKERDSLYAPLDVKKDEADDNMVKVRDDEPDPVKAEEKKAEEARVYAGKHKSPDDLEKAYTELQKKFSRGDHKPVDVESYKHEKLADFGIPDDDPLLAGFNEFAKEHKISTDEYNGLIDTFLNAVGAQDVMVKQAREQISQELGPNAEAIIGDMGQWAQGLAASGVWSAEEYAWFQSAADSAVGTRALLKIRESYADRIPFKAAVPTDAGKISKNELEQLMDAKDQDGNLRYYVDAAYRADVDRKASASFS